MDLGNTEKRKKIGHQKDPFKNCLMLTGEERDGGSIDFVVLVGARDRGEFSKEKGRILHYRKGLLEKKVEGG